MKTTILDPLATWVYIPNAVRIATAFRWSDHLPLWLFRKLFPAATVYATESDGAGFFMAKADWSEYQLAFAAVAIVAERLNGHFFTPSAVEAVARSFRNDNLDAAMAFEDAPREEYTGTVLGDIGELPKMGRTGFLVQHKPLP